MADGSERSGTRPSPGSGAEATGVSRRLAMALFGGALAGGLVELITDRTLGPEPVASLPTGSAPASAPASASQQTSAAPPSPSAAPTSPTAAPTAPPLPPAPPATAFAAEPALRAALTEIPRGKNVAFGLGVLDARTGRRVAVEVGSPFEMASTVKVDILVATYVAAAARGRGLTATQRAQASTMIRNSDNAAATSLFRAAGRAAGLNALYRALGLTGTTSSSSWGLTTTTPADRLVVLDALTRGGGGLRPEHGAEILALMRSVAASQRWGIGGAAAAGETVAVKNGWLPRSSQGGRWIISTSGLLTGPDTDLRLAVCSRGHASQAAGITFIEKVLKAARASLSV
ncbi:MAG: serine hydrolase [Actinomycetales bacterium]|nr:serine hydrolase [Actinomycetales bacterium]